MPDNSLETVQLAVKELRETFEKSSKDADVLLEAKMEKINKFLDEQETKNQKLVADLEKQARAEEELKEKVEALEKAAAEMPVGATQDEKSILEAEMKAVNDFIRNGEKSEQIKELEKKYLRTDKLEDGGALVPINYTRQLIKDITEVSPIRQFATVRQSPISKLEMPIRTSLMTITRAGEYEDTTASNSKYGRRSMRLHRYTGTTEATYEELSESMLNLESEMYSDFVEALEAAQGYDFVKGEGVVGAKGFVTHSEVGELSVSGGTITTAAVIELAGEPKTTYARDGRYFMNRKSITKLRLERATDNQYLWQLGNIAAGIPSTFNGYEYVETPDMDNPTTVNGYPVVFGDLRKAYIVGDSLGVRVTRDPYSKKTRDAIEFTFVIYTGGEVVQPEAIKKLKVTS